MSLVLLLGCATLPADSGPDGAPAADVVWYGDVEPIVTASCTSCHVAGGLGGFPLDSYATAAPMAAAIADAVEARRMPPWKAADDCNDYRGDTSLSEESIARLRAWADAGAPEGDAAKSTPVAPPDTTLPRVDETLELPIAYSPVADVEDDYRCFLVDWPRESTTYVTGYRVVPGNPALVHHVIAYIAPSSTLAEYTALDEADSAPGWTCYGGPGLGSQGDAEWLGAWAPGGGERGEFPNGTGIRMREGSKVVLQVHYNNRSGDTQPDLTRMEVMVSDEVESPAYIQPWADPEWLDGTGMDIPANTDGTSHSFALTNSWGDFKVHTASLHMHQLGRSATLKVADGGNGGDTCLLTIDDWDFNWQNTYVLAEPVTVKKGDTLSVSCTWDNPTDEDVNWGEGTGDEMCLGTMLVSY
jgi:hypothetical protein